MWLAASGCSPAVGRRSMSVAVRAALDQFTRPHPSGPHPPGSHPSGPHPSGQGRLTISVAPPAGAISESGGPDSGVPVLYVVDGDLLFGMAAEIARAVSSVAAFPAHYVVGIGYVADYADFLKPRTADPTPPTGR